ncbi:glycosyltransferase [Corynebacterium guangdongense]|uniref:Glycosyltransferase n=1 Tax=Corynebacterium guangdongense TaxID=1783348 RepID=A0ABU1ZWB9_9CORY|nr:glycosyltransferase [Corynebacterium guangdongense]MDR7329155.1 hypothetical protein [Corynebacterium guangdongense]WJZ17724.1 Chondroitin synthase [Corynebacterium guangdongense]
MRLTHVIVGPAEHGVTEYALALHRATGGDHVRELSALKPGASGPVHVTFTDHLFGPSPDHAVDAVLAAVGDRPFSVSLHDIPQPEEGRERFARRAPAYRRLAEAADVVVCNSRHEASFFHGRLPDGRLRVIHLPLPNAPRIPVQPEPGSVGILGFIYPGKGHRTVLEAADGLRVRALGGFSAGHEDMDLPGMEITGYLSDEELWRQMARIAVPVCAHRHFSASGSLMRWLAAGRRVLVADSAYTREIADLWPGQIVPVTDWPAALAAAAADPGFSTPVTDASRRRWGWAEVARAWQDAWVTCFAEDFRGNRLPPQAPAATPPISVVIPYYENQAGLDEVLAGLSAAAYPGPLEVIVADDGSAAPPRTDTDLDVTVVHQDDLGFRAAAARNLGAAAARHEVLVFLDGDTVPAPGYLRAAARWVAADERALVVGARRQDGGEPGWLADAWRDTRQLRHLDDASWRFVISSVLTCSATLFHEVGGFDASMVGYGGEDWEFGWRCYNAGARFRHDPEAVATHREPDWGARHDAGQGLSLDGVTQKNRESVALAHRVTHPLARPRGVVFAEADILLRIPGELSEGLNPGVLEELVSAWLAAGDVHVSIGQAPALAAADPRVGPDARGRVEVRLTAAVVPVSSPADLVARVEALGGRARVRGDGQALAEVTAPRHDPAEEPAVVHVDWPLLSDPVRLERRFAGW